MPSTVRLQLLGEAGISRQRISSRCMTLSTVLINHLVYMIQIFTVTDALLIEEYLFNVVLQLHDMTHGMYSTQWGVSMYTSYFLQC